MTTGRAWGKAVVTLAAVLAVIVSAAAVPAVLGTETAPARELVEFTAGQEVAGSLSGGGLGALSAADATRVGGTASGAPLRSQDTAVHFVVRSNRPTYWRTGAYGRYTGQGWERTGGSEPFDGSFPEGGLGGETITYRVTLKQSATALPTAWRPTTLNRTDGLRLQPGVSVSATEGLRAGTSYRGVSSARARDPAVLRSAGRNYPASVTDRYLGLPNEPGTRELASFTDELTADAETPYETARAIEAYLESNKAYSLNASHDPEAGTVASQFVFEMESGYCEYFATAMTAMLRTQGIPARYVVGYSTGQETAPGVYTVRAMNAHAWVEVYFPDVGWVRFDPTPGQQRLSAEQAAFTNQTGSDPSAYDHAETGSPGESFGPNRTAGQPVDVSGTPTGSVTVTVSTVDGGTPNGSGTPAVGTGTPPGTGGGVTPDGTAGTGTPEVGSGTPGGTVETGTPDGTVVTGTTGGTPAGGTPPTGTPAGETPPTGTPGGTPTGGTPSTTPTGTPGDGTPTDGTPTDGTQTGDRNPIDVSLNRTAVPGATVAVQVTRDGEPVPGAAVRFNGERVGVTDDDGVVVGEVPYAAQLRITVVLNRSAATGRLKPPPLGAAGSALAGAVWDGTPPPETPPAGTAPGTSLDGTPPAGTQPAAPSSDAASVGQSDNESASEEYELDTRANVSVVGTVRANATVTVVASVADVPIRNATVLVDGAPVARTDRRGRSVVGLPAEPGNHTIAVRRDAVGGNRTIEIPALAVNASVAGPLALPLVGVRLAVTEGGEPVEGAVVTLNGQRVGETGPTGRLTTRLPFASQAEFRVTAGSARASTTVGGIGATTLGVAVVIGGLLGGAALLARRRGVTTSDLPGLFARVASRVVAAVVTLAAVLDRALTALAVTIREAIADRDPAGFLNQLGELARRAGATLLAWVGLAVAVLTAWLADLRAGTPTTLARPSDEGTSVGADEPDEAFRLRRAWRRLTALVSIRSVRTRTPGELARWAIERDGLPAEPVERLRDAYRAVEYGDGDPAEAWGSVRQAVGQLFGGDEE